MRRQLQYQRRQDATADLKLVAVAPQDGRPRLDPGLGEHVVEVDDLVPRLVADDEEHGAVLLLHSILDQRADALVHLLPHPRAGCFPCAVGGARAGIWLGFSRANAGVGVGRPEDEG
jgi:hypothetical protein